MTYRPDSAADTEDFGLAAARATAATGLANTQHIAGLGSREWHAKSDVVKYSDEGYRSFGLDRNNPSRYRQAMDRTPEGGRRMIEAKIRHACELASTVRPFAAVRNDALATHSAPALVGNMD